MAYLYILECADHTLYVGSTRHLAFRLWQHENGLGANHTRNRLPVKLVYFEKYDRVVEAFCREKQVQGWCHAKKRALIEGNRENIHKMAECRNDSHSKNHFPGKSKAN